MNHFSLEKKYIKGACKCKATRYITCVSIPRESELKSLVANTCHLFLDRFNCIVLHRLVFVAVVLSRKPITSLSLSLYLSLSHSYKVRVRIITRGSSLIISWQLMVLWGIQGWCSHDAWDPFYGTREVHASLFCFVVTHQCGYA